MQRRNEEAIQQIQEIIAELQSRGERITNKRIGELFNGGVSRQRINLLLKKHELSSSFCFDRKSYAMKLKSMNIDTKKYTSTELRKLVNYPVSKNFGNLLTDFNIPYVKSLRYNFDGIDTSKYTIRQLMYEIGYKHSEQDLRNLLNKRNVPYKRTIIEKLNFEGINTEEYTVNELMTRMNCKNSENSFRGILFSRKIPYKHVAKAYKITHNFDGINTAEYTVKELMKLVNCQCCPNSFRKYLKKNGIQYTNPKKHTYDFDGINTAEHTVNELMKLVDCKIRANSFRRYLEKNEIPFKRIWKKKGDSD